MTLAEYYGLAIEAISIWLILAGLALGMLALVVLYQTRHRP